MNVETILLQIVIDSDKNYEAQNYAMNTLLRV